MLLGMLSKFCPFIQQVLLAAIVVTIDWVLFNNAEKNSVWWHGLQGPEWLPRKEVTIMLCLLFVALTLVTCILGSYSKMGTLCVFAQFCESACVLGIGISLFARETISWAVACAAVLLLVLLIELAWACLRVKLLAILLLFPAAWAAVVLVAISQTADRTNFDSVPHTDQLKLAAGLFSSAVDSLGP